MPEQETTAHRTPKKPAVSIGMPVFNGEKYIRKAIDSLLAQIFSDFELIISDNASTDGTAAICREYAANDSRIRYIRQPENIGAENNFKYVLRESVGEYFMWAACDDSWSPDWISSIVQNFQDTDIGLFGKYRNGDTSVVSSPSGFRKAEFTRFFLSTDTSGKCFYTYAIFRKKLLQQAAVRMVHCPIGADQVFLLNVLLLGDLRTVGSGIFNYRVHDDCLSSSQSRTYGKLKRLIFSMFPFEYYRLTFKAVPWPHNVLVLMVMPMKYLYEQVRGWRMLGLGLLHRFSRKQG